MDFLACNMSNIFENLSKQLKAGALIGGAELQKFVGGAGGKNIFENIAGVVKTSKKFVEDILRDVPRSIAQLELKGLGVKEFTPETTAQKIIFGTEPIKIPEKTGEEMLSGLGVKEETAKRFGGALGYPLTILGAIPIFPGKKKAAEAISKEAAEAISKEASENVIMGIVKKEIKDITDDEALNLSRELVPIKDSKEVQSKIGDWVKIKESETLAAVDESSAYPKSVDRIATVLKEAIPKREEQEVIYSAARKQRFARAKGIGEKLEGEEWAKAVKGEMKGEMPKVEYHPIREQLGEKNVNFLYNKIKEANLRMGETLTAIRGYEKLLKGKLPTKGEIKILEKIFPMQTIDKLKKEIPLFQKIWGKMKEATRMTLATPRSLLTEFSPFSGFARQMLAGATHHPIRAMQSFLRVVRRLPTEEAESLIMERIEGMRNYELMRSGGLALVSPETAFTRDEELFMESLLDIIPGVKTITGGMRRYYRMMLNDFRATIFNDLATAADKYFMNVYQKSGLRIGLESQTKNLFGIPTGRTYAQNLAEVVNNSTGRGSLGRLEPLLQEISTAIFAPRLLSSRLNMFNPLFYIKLDPIARKEALKTLFSLTGTITGIAALSKMAGADVSLDSNSSDFLKTKIGNTRFDFSGGYQQVIVAASRLISGYYTKSTTGERIKLGEGYKPMTRASIFLRFLQSKESPIASFVSDWMTGRTFIGEEFNISNEIYQRVVDLTIQDLIEIANDDPDMGKMIFGGILSELGVGVQTYKSKRIGLDIPSFDIFSSNIPFLDVPSFNTLNTLDISSL